MTKKVPATSLLPRRRAIRELGALALSVSALGNACSDGAEGDDRPMDGADASAGGDWASGTTAMLGDPPDPFTSGLGAACELTCAATLGPCYATTMVRKDISEGVAGLPMRLSFLIVDPQCAPVEGAEIDIWHTAPRGVYSGDDNATLRSFCALNDDEAIASSWFRGVQVTDQAGRADFDTCYPGWYSGRTIHIHLTVRIGSTDFVTTQLYFGTALNLDVLSSHPLYSDRGMPDTTNDNDGLIGSPLAAYAFEAAKQADGTLHAWKTLVIRSSTLTPMCQS